MEDYDETISIHSPHAGRDGKAMAQAGFRDFDFNPLSPCGERPPPDKPQAIDVVISIHSPHAGRDFVRVRKMRLSEDFNPLSPCGERLCLLRMVQSVARFQSTLPMRGETNLHLRNIPRGPFQSTLPMRGETYHTGYVYKYLLISIHSPHAGRDKFWIIKD